MIMNSQTSRGSLMSSVSAFPGSPRLSQSNVPVTFAKHSNPNHIGDNFKPRNSIEINLLQPLNFFMPNAEQLVTFPEVREESKESLSNVNPNQALTPSNMKALSNRSETMKIFKTRIESIKKVEQDNQNSKPEKKKNPMNAQIKRHDSIKLIKNMIEQKSQEYSQKKKREKLKGSMYVNDLWANEYEKSIMKAVELDKELKEKIDFARKPLREKLKGLTEQFEQHMKNQAVQGNLEEVWSQKPGESSGASFQPITEDSSSEEAVRTESEGSQRNFPFEKISLGKMQKKLSTFSRQISFRDKTQQNLQGNKFSLKDRMNSLPDAFRIKTVRNVYLPLHTEGNSARNTPDILNIGEVVKTEMTPKSSNLGISSGLYSPKSPKNQSLPSPLSHRKRVTIQKIKSPFMQNFDEVIFKKDKVPLASPGRKKDEIKREFLEKSNGMIGELIDKCNTELDEGTECMDIIGGLHKILQKKKNTRDSTTKFNKEKKERVIENLKHMLDNRKDRKF